MNCFIVLGNMCDLTECTLGDNMFMRLEGDLNNTLDYLDIKTVDEYFYVPRNIFNISAHVKQNHTYCNINVSRILVLQICHIQGVPKKVPHEITILLYRKITKFEINMNIIMDGAIFYGSQDFFL